MKKFILNHNFFDDEFMREKNVSDKEQFVSEKAKMSESSFHSKRLGKRDFQNDDYEYIRWEVDERLILNTEKLIGKLLLRANLDLQPNEKFVLFNVLCNYDYNRPIFSLEDFLKQLLEPVIEKKIKKILDECKIKISKNGDKGCLYERSKEGYSLNLTNVIKYTELIE